MAHNINKEIEPFVRSWATGLVRVISANLRKKKVGITGDLLKSLNQKVFAKAEQVIAEINANYSIRFVDMGAGRGQTARQARFNRRTARKRKAVYNRTVYGALNSLQGAIGFTVMDEIFAEYNAATPNEIKL